MGPLARTVVLTVVVWASASVAIAQDAWVIRDIRLEGLQRITAGTIFNYLPLEVGDRVDELATAEAIRALFQTGFFRDIRMERDGDTLVISFVERPAIASIALSGNEAVKTEQLLAQLEQSEFAEGRIFDRADFDRVKQELERFYFGIGKYAVDIDATVTPLERNRVAVRFDIAEGPVARIKQINIVGNEVFEDEELLDLFTLRRPGLFTFFTKRDQYSREKLAADLEILRSFYHDRGYINFDIESTQVSITPDKRDVYVTINVSEGDQFTVRDIKLAGDLIVPPEELFERITVRRGGVFSRREVTQSSSDISARLGEEGYAFANVNAVPEIDDENKEVALTFFVDPGKRVYVRRVEFKGNTKTRDEVLRREMRQMESSWISTSAVERSRVRLQRLGFFDEVNVETPAVPGTTDQVDVEFSVKERPSGNLIAGVGFSQAQGVILNTSISQENFLGTGHQVSATFNNSSVNQIFSATYLNPYYTVDGVSLGVTATYRATDAQDANVSDYTTDVLRGAFNFGVPINEFDTVNLGTAIERVDFKPGRVASEEVLAFDDESEGQFSRLLLTADWSRDTRNSRLLPDEGSLTRISGELAVPGIDLSHYKINVSHSHFFPLTESFALAVDGRFGFGDGLADTEDLPLVDNFFAGGIGSVRGFEANTLGPRDSRDEPLGGNLVVNGTVELILPVPLVENSEAMRLTSFFDFGNVFGPDEDLELQELRTSVGLSAIWLSPLGAITVSAALPLNDKDEDDTQPIQFTFGTTF